AEKFVEPFARARAAGLGITVHAGEVVGARSVRNAVEVLGAQRIGHGIHAVESSEVVRLLYTRDVALEVCPTSNFQTGAVRGLTLHPLQDLFGLRLKVTINTDDPSVSDTTLTDEYLVAVEAIGLPQHWICQALLNAADAAFAPEEERIKLKEDFQQILASCPSPSDQ
ncbi:MAG: adenosine deaminase family protein, partial [Anaerolineae bacterium]